MENCSRSKNQLSYQFTKFMFGVVLRDLRNKEIVLKFDTPRFMFRPSGISKESVRNLLKHLDFDYKRDDEGNPASYRDMSNADMTRHLQWIERQVAYSGYTLEYITEEWNKLIERYT